MNADGQNKSFADFLKEMVRKKYGNEESKDILSNPDDSTVRNLKRELKRLLKGLGYEDILKNDIYMLKNKKIFPEYILVFFEVLLFLPSGKKDTLGSKIKNKKFIKITEDEIEDFAEKIRETFQTYGKTMIVKELDSERQKELDNMIDEADDLDEVENDWDNAVEEEYIHRKWELLRKAEMYAEEVKKVLENKKKIMLAEERMGTMVQDRVKEVLGLPEILDRKIDILVDYKSDIDGLKDIKFTMPSSYTTTTQEEETSLTSGEKLFLLEQFEMYLKMYLAKWDILLENYKKEKELGEQEYFSERRENLPNMSELFTKTCFNLCVKEKMEKLHKNSKNK